MTPSVPGALQDPFGLAGTLLEGQYRADAVVGEGGFGVVYRGRHLSLDQPIAIKVLKGLDGGDARVNGLVLEKFRAEARLLYTLSQSSLHIVRSLDFGATTMPAGTWAPFMVLEWLDGRSLADDLVMRRERGMRGRSLEETFALLEPVADGLGAAHRQHVAHRDVKPANIFLLDPNAAGRHGPLVKVLDFGIAKIMKEGEAVGTKGTFASFTWLYAAPEQLDPRLGATGLATDVYGFGLLLTELLTDRKPVDGRDVVEIMKAASDPHRRPTPRMRGANIPDAIEAVCQRALSVDPRHRPSTITELWAALVAAREGGRAVTTMQPSVRGVSSDPNPFSSANVSPPALVGPPVAPPAPARHHTALPMSVPNPPAGHSPPFGTRPPGIVTPPPFAAPFQAYHPGMHAAPPPGTTPSYPGPMMPYAASPPPGTRPPGHAPARPFVRTDGTSPVVVVTIVLFVLAILFAGSCAVLHGACNAVS